MEDEEGEFEKGVVTSDKEEKVVEREPEEEESTVKMEIEATKEVLLAEAKGIPLGEKVHFSVNHETKAILVWARPSGTSALEEYTLMVRARNTDNLPAFYYNKLIKPWQTVRDVVEIAEEMRPDEGETHACYTEVVEIETEDLGDVITVDLKVFEALPSELLTKVVEYNGFPISIELEERDVAPVVTPEDEEEVDDDDTVEEEEEATVQEEEVVVSEVVDPLDEEEIETIGNQLIATDELSKTLYHVIRKKSYELIERSEGNEIFSSEELEDDPSDVRTSRWISSVEVLMEEYINLGVVDREFQRYTFNTLSHWGGTYNPSNLSQVVICDFANGTVIMEGRTQIGQEVYMFNVSGARVTINFIRSSLAMFNGRPFKQLIMEPQGILRVIYLGGKKYPVEDEKYEREPIIYIWKVLDFKNISTSTGETIYMDSPVMNYLCLDDYKELKTQALEERAIAEAEADK